MENYMYLVPVAAVLALLFAAYLAAKVSKQDAGTDRMKEIAGCDRRRCPRLLNSRVQDPGYFL